jgi:hypothetical protein
VPQHSTERGEGLNELAGTAINTQSVRRPPPQQHHHIVKGKKNSYVVVIVSLSLQSFGKRSKIVTFKKHQKVNEL